MRLTGLIVALMGSSTLVSALTPGVELTRRPATMQTRRAARKVNRFVRSSPMRAAEGLDTHVAATSDNRTFTTTSSGNWAGAVLVGSGFKNVSGTFTVPTPATPPGAWPYQTYSYSAWVGIDGDTCNKAILQAGITGSISAFGARSYSAWYEWFPDASYTFSGFAVGAGDSVTVKVAAASTTSGTVTIINNSRGTRVSHDFKGETRGQLCETNAEWIVEDFEQCVGQNVCSQVPMADFGTIRFTDVSPALGFDPTVINMVQDKRAMTSCGTEGNSTVVCQYV